ncbi:hypothetical protein TWF730_001417 [Orbilia blumenaviensis]|uniref:MARVEL domain-containing protein n=1 Tax=Orbilia blumenaviensis TaxID=1796055 RepID=A0AAV9UHL4_9PEZI
MGFSPILGIRIAAGVLSIIILGVDAYAISAFNNTRSGSSPSSMNFVIFCVIWTWLSLAYILITPRFLPRLHDKWILLAVEALATLFWFSGFVAVAAYVGDHSITCPESVCGSIKATIAFSCFEWLAWVASLVLVCLSIFKGRSMMGAVPMMEAQHKPLTGVGVDSTYMGGGGIGGGYASSIGPQPMGFNPSETPAPYGGPAVSPAPYDPHLQPAHLQAQNTGVSTVSALSSGPYSAAYQNAQITGDNSGNNNGHGQAGPYDPHYSQHGDYSAAAEMPAGYSGQARFS